MPCEEEEWRAEGYKGDKGEYDEQELVRQRERSAEETEDK